MESLLTTLSKNAPQAILVLLALVVCLAITSFILIRRISFVQKRWRTLLEGTSGASLENLLYDHLRERMALQEELKRLEDRTRELEARMATSKRHLGLVKYDAFDDVGGAQSFALAFYDDKGDGAILTSLVGRADCRVYAKPINGGRSERTLSQEEQRAIQEAKNGGPRSIVTP